MLRLSACLLAISTLPVFAQSTDIQHEIALGFSDVRDADDNFIGASYRYYFQSVNIDQQPWSISPYLQRKNNVSVDYFGIDNIDSVNVRGEWFYSNALVIRGRYGRVTNDNRYFDETLNRYAAEVSTFANQNWEYGVGVEYFHLNEELFSSIDVGVSEERSDSEFSYSAFARYTSFGQRAGKFLPGWDTKLKATQFDGEFSIELDTDYYFRPDWSVGVTYIHESNEVIGSDNVIELGTHYWFNPHSSIEFGIGYDTDENQLGSATLLGTFRF